MAVHISGCDNVKAEHHSRFQVEDSPLWYFGLTYLPMVALFATRWNSKVEAFFSCLPYPFALPRDAIQADWSRSTVHIPSSVSCPVHSISSDKGGGSACSSHLDNAAVTPKMFVSSGPQGSCIKD